MNKTTIILLILVAVLLAGLAYMFGKSQTFKAFSSLNSATNQTALTTQSLTPTVSPLPTPTPTQAVQTRDIKAGGFLSFPKYTITVPIDWKDSRETPAPNSEKIILTKDDYQISILQGAFGGGTCLYPGDTAVEGPSASYTNFTDLTNKSGDNFRISQVKGGYAVCQKTQYGWANPTLYGAIDIKIPGIPPSVMLSQITSILSSLEKR